MTASDNFRNTSMKTFLTNTDVNSRNNSRGLSTDLGSSALHRLCYLLEKTTDFFSITSSSSDSNITVEH